MAGHDPDVLYVSGLVAAIFQSPTWVTPIAKFVDENCGIFEDQEENKLEYTLIHNAFKQLVDELLEAHLQELDVSQDQFTRFCQHGLSGDNEFHRELVEQLLSVDDFCVFKALMVKRNAQLYRQALEAFGLHLQPSAPELEGGGDIVPQVDGPPDMVTQALAAPPEGLGPQAESQELDQQRLEVAELEAEKLELQRKCVEAELQLAMALSMQLQKRLQLMEALSEVLEALADMKEGAEELLAAEAASTEAPVHVQPTFAVTSPSQGHGAAQEVEAAEAALQRERAGRAVAASRETLAAREAQARAAAAATAAQPQPTEEERQLRAAHLKRQRDMLVEKKNRDREQQLSSFQQTHGPTVAARAAEEAMVRQSVAGPGDAGKLLAAELSGQTPVPPPVPTPAQDTAAAEMRRMLTRQLKHTLTGSMPGR